MVYIANENGSLVKYSVFYILAYIKLGLNSFVILMHNINPFVLMPCHYHITLYQTSKYLIRDINNVQDTVSAIDQLFIMKFINRFRLCIAIPNNFKYYNQQIFIIFRNLVIYSNEKVDEVRDYMMELI